LLHARALTPYPRDQVVDLADVYKKLVAENQLAGYEIGERFYEIGSHVGLQELHDLLTKKTAS
ncbi:MAG TPA: nucleotidyl transferase, partial [Opitutaceae bacterium]